MHRTLLSTSSSRERRESPPTHSNLFECGLPVCMLYVAQDLALNMLGMMSVEVLLLLIFSLSSLSTSSITTIGDENSESNLKQVHVCTESQGYKIWVYAQFTVSRIQTIQTSVSDTGIQASASSFCMYQSYILVCCSVGSWSNSMFCSSWLVAW